MPPIFVNHIRLLLTVSVVYYWTLGMAQARFIYQGTSPHHVPDVPVSTNRKFSAKWIMDNFASITTNSIHDGAIQIFYYRVGFLQEWSANLGWKLIYKIQNKCFCDSKMANLAILKFVTMFLFSLIRKIFCMPHGEIACIEKNYIWLKISILGCILLVIVSPL